MKILKPTFADRAPLDTPFARAKAEWDERMGAPMVQAAYWRLLALLLLVPLSISLVGNIYLARRQRQVEPVYIAIDSLGQASVLNGLETKPRPDDTVIAFHLREFVESVRRVSADPSLNTRGWTRAYWFATPHGRAMLSAYLGPYLNQPEIPAQKGVVSIECEAPLKITDGSWQVDWKEQRWDISGRPGPVTKWRGTFRLVLSVPKKRADAIQNPVGMFVDEFHWVELHPKP